MTEILIVDDEPDIRLLVEAILRDEGFEARSAGNSDEAIAAYRARRPSLVILDVWLQGSKLDGIGILDVLHQEQPRVPVVMISGHGTIETAVAAIQRGAYDFIEKPFNSDRLLLVVRRALEAARLEAENAELRLRVGSETALTGEGHGIVTLKAAIEPRRPHRLARAHHGCPRLGQGNRGAHDPRAVAPRRRPFCGAELRDPGAGALRGRTVRRGSRGRPAGHRAGRRAERAHGGTLLLDEVAEMPLETPGKIARVFRNRASSVSAAWQRG